MRTWMRMFADLSHFDVGMPRGSAELAVSYAARAAAAASRVTGSVYEVSRVAVLGHLLLPLVVGDPPIAHDARRAAGGGWFHSDVIPEDEELLEVLASGAPTADAEELARIAQECRLPVTPYRAEAAPWSVPSVPPGPTAPAGRPSVDPAAITVVDMTAMWAGPLCTALLASWGARVLTIEPTSRPDGLRGSPAQFAVLDRGKDRRPWDLRDEADRGAFEDALGSADVLVESFSERVLPNLGYRDDLLAALNPHLTAVRIRAFPRATAEATWVAFGRGVHAASGLGTVEGRPVPALLAYPDPLAGLLAFARVLEALGSPAGAERIDVSLADAIAPLLRTAGQPLGPVDDGATRELQAASGVVPGGVIARAT